MKQRTGRVRDRQSPAPRLDELSEPSGQRFRERVYAYVRRLPAGRVTTYGEVAAELGSPRAARVVGAALHALPAGSDVPWQRVINAQGRISIKEPEHARRQEQLLRDEGIEFSPAGVVELGRYNWSPPADVAAVERSSRGALAADPKLSKGRPLDGQ